MSVEAISFAPIPVRVAAALFAAAVVSIAIFTFLWGFANTSSLNAEYKEVGDLLAWLSPSDPQTHFAAASLHEKSLETGDFEIALREYEAAAALAPQNYLLWLRLASVRGRAGDIEGTEAALRRAQQLAPNYSRVDWALGNFLLREGKDDEAYAELRKAVAADPTLAPLAAATSLQMSDGDVRAVTTRFQDSPRINTALAMQLAALKRFDEAAALWNRTDLQSDDSYLEVAKQLRDKLIENRMFRAAATLRGLTDASNNNVPESISNPGFEQSVKSQDAEPFDWKVTQGAYPQIGVTDTQKMSGNFSLIVLLGGQDSRDFRGPSQLIAVRPGGAYDLSAGFRSDAKSLSSFYWEIVSAKDSRRLAISGALGSLQNWSKISIPFTVPTDTDGIVIRFVRGECSGGTCVATGNYWFDDFSLTSK